MSYSFKLKNGEVAIFDSENSILSITSIYGEENRSTLGRAESRLLSLLLSDPGATKSRVEIVEYVWDDRVVASGSLNQAIFSLRNTLNDSREHEILMTVPRRGYRFNRDYLMLATDSKVATPNIVDSQVTPAIEPADTALGGSRSPVKKTRLNPLITGYAIFLPFAIFTIFHSGFFQPSKIVSTEIIKNDVSVHLIAKNAQEAEELKQSVTKHIENLPQKLIGQVWISLTKSGYAISCIRSDRSTLNLLFDKNQTDHLKMVQQCLEQSL